MSVLDKLAIGSVAEQNVVISVVNVRQFEKRSA